MDLSFGKYGWFVWPAYVVFALVIGGIVLQTILANRRTRQALERAERRKGGAAP